MPVQVVVGMASKGLRCICLTYTDYPLHDAARPADFFEEADRVDNNLVCCAIVGIKDPVRWVAAADSRGSGLMTVAGRVGSRP
jgi:magnesium-transporting ATPase (P-type)